jgi:hypothetical protein
VRSERYCARFPARFWRFGIPPRRLVGFCGASAVQPDGCGSTEGDPDAKGSKEADYGKPRCIIQKAAKTQDSTRKGARTAVRSGTKQSAAIEMLRSPGGASIAALTKATRWQPHSVRGFLAGVVRKRLKLDVQSAVVEGVRIYRITGGHGATPVKAKPDGRKS